MPAVALDLGDDLEVVLVWSVVEVGHTRSVEPHPGPVPFGCTVERGACTAWVQLTGELDLATAPVLQQHLQEALAHAGLVVLDLRQLSFIDAAGLRVIYGASANANADGRRLTLIRGPERVHKLFTLTGLSERLDMLDVAEHEGNLKLIKAQLSARDGVHATDEGPNRIDGTTPGELAHKQELDVAETQDSAALQRDTAILERDEEAR